MPFLIFIGPLLKDADGNPIKPAISDPSNLHVIKDLHQNMGRLMLTTTAFLPVLPRPRSESCFSSMVENTNNLNDDADEDDGLVEGKYIHFLVGCVIQKRCSGIVPDPSLGPIKYHLQLLIESDFQRLFSTIFYNSLYSIKNLKVHWKKM